MNTTQQTPAAPPTVRNAYWMTADEVAIALDCSPRSIWKWADTGLIPAPVKRGNKWTRWRRQEIEAYVRGNADA